MKICSCCGQPFPLAEFGKNRQTPDGLAYYTREHAAAKQKKFRDAHPEQAKAARGKYLDRLRAQNDQNAQNEVSNGQPARRSPEFV